MKIVGILGIILIIFVVSISGCTNSDPGNKTYTGNNITFDYPADWEINSDGAITTPNSGIGAVNVIGSIEEYANEPPQIEATLEAVAQDAQNSNGGSYDKKIITIGGVKGIEYTPLSSGDANQKRIDVYFAKGDTLYNIYLTSNDYEADLPGFNMIIDSLKIN